MAVHAFLCAVTPADAAERTACFAEALRTRRVRAVACRQVEPPAELTEIDPEPILGDELDLAMLELEPVPEAPPDDEKEDVKPEGQVVDIPRPAAEVAPRDAKYLAEFDSSVERETVKHGKPGAAAAARPRAPPAPETARPQPTPMAPPPALVPGPPGPGSLSMRTPGRPLTRELAPRDPGTVDGFSTTSPDGLGPGRGAPAEPTDQAPIGGLPGGGAGGVPAPDFRPTPDLIDRTIGSGTRDYLPDVEDGETTALNARRWKYATFFNRVKEQVAQNWHPEVAYRLRDPNGNIYGHKDRLTVLQVSLHPDGKVAKLYVTQPSGVEFLDDEALEAFRAADPFPNPPSALIDEESQLITFRFGFMFEIDNRQPFRIFRYQH
jgi:TonB family protein